MFKIILMLNVDEYEYWDIPLDNNWTIEQIPQGTSELPDDPDFDGHTSCFVSTYRLCSKKQTIVLKNHGLTKTIMNFLQPEILVSDW